MNHRSDWNGCRPVALFNFQSTWMRQMIRQAAPPDIDVRFLNDPRDPRQLDELLPHADFFVTIELPADWVPRLRRCKLVQLQGVGYDAVDLDAIDSAGIPLAATPEGTTVGVAEHTMLFILALSKRLVEVHRSVERGEFDKLGWRDRCHFVAGRTLGIVGMGRIGRRVARLANAFEARVIYYDIARVDFDFDPPVAAEYHSFEELLSAADIVSLHTPLTADTAGLFAADEFARMKRGALFINTSRGGTYDMDALYESLRSGHLGGAGLDVFNPQPPPPNHPLLGLPNVICTPHMATGTVEAHMEKARAQFANFARILRNEAPRNLVTSGMTTL